MLSPPHRNTPHVGNGRASRINSQCMQPNLVGNLVEIKVQQNEEYCSTGLCPIRQSRPIFSSTPKRSLSGTTPIFMRSHKTTSLRDTDTESRYFPSHPNQCIHLTTKYKKEDRGNNHHFIPSFEMSMLSTPSVCVPVKVVRSMKLFSAS